MSERGKSGRKRERELVVSFLSEERERKQESNSLHGVLRRGGWKKKKKKERGKREGGVASEQVSRKEKRGE